MAIRSFALIVLIVFIVVGGAVLVLLGLLQVTGVWTALISRMQGLIAGWQPPI